MNVDSPVEAIEPPRELRQVGAFLAAIYAFLVILILGQLICGG